MYTPGFIASLQVSQRDGFMKNYAFKSLVKLLLSVFLLVLIIRSVCFGEEETPADNSALGKKLVNSETLNKSCSINKLSTWKQAELKLAAPQLAAPPAAPCALKSVGETALC